MAKEPVFLYLATFRSLADAKTAYARVREMHGAGVISTYDAAVVSKDESGDVKVRKDETPTRRGAWTGLVVGALVGLLVPPFFLADVAVALAGAGAGALLQHFRRGMSRSDARDLGALIASSEAALVVIGRSPLTHVVRAEQIDAVRQWEGQLSTDGEKVDMALADAIAAMARDEADEAEHAPRQAPKPV